MTAHAACNENARLIERKIVVQPIMRRGRRWLVFLCVHEGGDNHAREGNRKILALPHRVAFDLELTAERRQLRSDPADVTRAAAWSCLFREARNGIRRDNVPCQQPDREETRSRKR